MSAHASMLPNAYTGPEFVPFVCEDPALANETGFPPESSAESLRLEKGFLTAIDFEVAAAVSLCAAWHADWRGDVYLIRTLERISEHLKALKAIRATVNQSSER